MPAEPRLPFTSSVTDMSLLSAASDQTGADKEPAPSSTDSEDNIPLSELKKSCVLISKARRSLMKVNLLNRCLKTSQLLTLLIGLICEKVQKIKILDNMSVTGVVNSYWNANLFSLFK